MDPPRDDTGSVTCLLRSLGPLAFARLLRSMMFSCNHYYFLGRNLLPPLNISPGSSTNGAVSPISAEDIDDIRGQLDSFEPQDRREIMSRLIFYGRGFRNCYVMRHGDDLAYIQWIIFPSENDLITRWYSRRYYTLATRQVMIENAFTFPRYRGRGYLQSGTLQLLELARNSGYGSAVCYIRKDRITPLNEFTRMGFKIIKLLGDYKLAGMAWRTL